MIDAARYAALAAQFGEGWARDEQRRDEPAIAALLLAEARALDEGRFEDWLAMLDADCVYWVPGAPGAADPLKEVAIAFDDRRLLEGRIYRLRSGHAWSQVPASRTARLVSNVEAFATGDEAVRMVRSSFVTAEHRAGETRLFAGWNAHRVARANGAWRIVVKQVNLIDCDQNLRNPSLIL